jgi:hypothetical protein
MNNATLILDLCQEAQVKNNLAMDNKFSTVFASAHEVRVFWSRQS